MAMVIFINSPAPGLFLLFSVRFKDTRQRAWLFSWMDVGSGPDCPSLAVRP